MRTRIFATASAAVLSLALGVSSAYAGASGNEGDPAGGTNPSPGQEAPTAAPAAPNEHDGGPRTQGTKPGKAEEELAAQPSSGKTGERSDEKSDKAPKGAAKSGEDRNATSAERGKDEVSGDRERERPAEKSAEGKSKDERLPTMRMEPQQN